MGGGKAYVELIAWLEAAVVCIVKKERTRSSPLASNRPSLCGLARGPRGRLSSLFCVSYIAS